MEIYSQDGDHNEHRGKIEDRGTVIKKKLILLADMSVKRGGGDKTLVR